MAVVLTEREIHINKWKTKESLEKERLKDIDRNRGIEQQKQVFSYQTRSVWFAQSLSDISALCSCPL